MQEKRRNKPRHFPRCPARESARVRVDVKGPSVSHDVSEQRAATTHSKSWQSEHNQYNTSRHQSQLEAKSKELSPQEPTVTNSNISLFRPRTMMMREEDDDDDDAMRARNSSHRPQSILKTESLEKIDEETELRKLSIKCKFSEPHTLSTSTAQVFARTSVPNYYLITPLMFMIRNVIVFS